MANGTRGGTDRMEPVHREACGIDVGNEEHWVAVPPGCDASPVQKFGTFTEDLRKIASWLTRCGVTTVALESTGVYWIPLFEVLEAQGMEVCLVDTQRLKAVPGRKSDAMDCQWLQQLHTYGLLQSAFRPPEAITVVRTYRRQRQMLIEGAVQHIQHMQKALQQMNIKLSNVVSDTSGKTGMAIIDAILAGERDPHQLAKWRDPRCRNSEATIARSLEGHWRADHLFELRQAVELYRFYREKLAECDEQIAEALASLPDRTGGQQLPPTGRKRKQNPNAPRFDARELLFRSTGVDLTAIDGIDANAAMVVISEIGTDVSAWPSAKHFSSWLTACPGNKKTGGKVYSTKTRRSANRVLAALRTAAQSLQRSPSALGAFYRRMRARVGGPAAITAAAHKLARRIYAMLKYREPYLDPGQDAYEKQYRERQLRNLARRAEKFGLALCPADPATGTTGAEPG